jgi:hypothetical protein
MVSLQVQADEKLHTACDECSEHITETTRRVHQLLISARNAKIEVLGTETAM